MKTINFNRLIASNLCMIGLTASILICSNKIEEGLINWIYLIFFEFCGILLLYNGLNKSQDELKKELKMENGK